MGPRVAGLIFGMGLAVVFAAHGDAWPAVAALALVFVAHGAERRLELRQAEDTNREEVLVLHKAVSGLRDQVAAVRSTLDPAVVEKIQKDVQALTEAEALRRMRGGR